MSEQNNGNDERLDKLETNLAEMEQAQKEAFAKLSTFEDRQNYLSEKIAELVHAQMRSEAKAEKEMSAIRQTQAQTQTHLDHLTQLVRFFGDKSFAFDGKVKKVGELLLSDETNAA
jgi:chromosome segregation ATPase